MSKAQAVSNLSFIALTTYPSAQAALNHCDLFWWTFGGCFAVRYLVDYAILVAPIMPTLKLRAKAPRLFTA